VDFSRFDPERVPRGRVRAEFGIPADARVVVSISRYAERKGQRYEMEAMLHLLATRPDVHMLFMGPCRAEERPFRDELASRAAAAPGGERVHLLDERRDIPEVLADADVLVRAALAEGLPNCALEAMAMRVPVVATGICGTPEAVLDSVTGRLVPPADVHALTNALGDLLDAGVERRREMGEAGRRHVLATFALDRMADEYEALFERAVRMQSGGRAGHG
jgi:glycosyltransferase involved in cell wall biosynthesis